MAKSKKTAEKTKSKWGFSWSGFFIAASVTLNIAFIVLMILLMATNVLDGMLMDVGLKRYCSSANDDKFSDSTAKVRALRAYTCGAGDAQQYFEAGFQNYLNAKGIK